MREPRDVIARAMYEEDFGPVPEHKLAGWFAPPSDQITAAVILTALAGAGFAVVQRAAVEFVIDECTSPDDKYYNFIDGEWLRKHLRTMLAEFA